MDSIADNIIRIALRDGNSLRSELLVNLIQAKHVPCDPVMIFELISMLAKVCEDVDLGKTVVIGFAETATAIGAIMAYNINPGSFYIHTTRETSLSEDVVIRFQEEHSHASEHIICQTPLERELERADSLVFIDDEITTGNTLGNAVSAISRAVKIPKETSIFAASIINRLTGDSYVAASGENVTLKRLLNQIETPDSIVHNAHSPAECHFDADVNDSCQLLIAKEYAKPKNPRLGVSASEYMSDCVLLGQWLIKEIADRLKPIESVAVIGTEECMLPAIVCGKIIAENYSNITVKSHSTTRSPISVSEDQDYPIQNGYALRSVYESSRKTFIYNVDRYDLLIVITDATPRYAADGLHDISRLFANHGTSNMVAVVI